MRIRGPLLIALAVPLAGASRLGAAPPNDGFANRAPLPGLSGDVAGSTLGATREPSEPFHAGNPGGSSAWWTWTPSQPGLATVATLGSGFDTILAVYRGSALQELQTVAESDDVGDNELRSLVTFTAQPGTTYQIAVDGYDGESGPVGLDWHLEPEGPAPPPNDLFASRARMESATGVVVESTRRARREIGEPVHANNAGGKSIWWSWVAPEDGTASFVTTGSSFDTLLAVYTGSDLGSLIVAGADDDGSEGTWSALYIEVSGGKEYQIAVDGFDGDSGMAVLEWRLTVPCAAPALAASPSPGHGAGGVPLDVTLDWSPPPAPARKVVYGADDRLEIYEIKDPAVLEAWESTVAIVSVTDLVDEGNTYSLPGDPLSNALPLCPTERFLDQPIPATCSGFLVAPDLVVTAGHCVASGPECNLTAFVFGFRMLGPGRPVLRFPKSQVYFCSGIVAIRETTDDVDWVVLRLDREVPDHAPLPIRRSGKVPNSQSLILIGHPLGLPAKVAAGARVRENAEPGFFTSNLDAYLGNSGSPVLDAESLVVEGILVSGEVDFVEAGDCLVTHRCEDTGCVGEAVTRSTEFDHAVPVNPGSVTYEVRLGRCGSLTLLGETSGTSMEAGPLEPATTYCWQVSATNGCGKTAGPIWSFTTGEGTPTFRRGDASRDGSRDITDAIIVLNYLFLGGEPPSCEKSADSDDDGRLNLSDPIYLLNHLFQGGLPPGAPHEDCGADPTPDDISCAASAPCL